MLSFLKPDKLLSLLHNTYWVGLWYIHLKFLTYLIYNNLHIWMRTYRGLIIYLFFKLHFCWFCKIHSVKIYYRFLHLYALFFSMFNDGWNKVLRRTYLQRLEQFQQSWGMRKDLDNTFKFFLWFHQLQCLYEIAPTLNFINLGVNVFPNKLVFQVMQLFFKLKALHINHKLRNLW
jgi:hypothetical protein